MEQISHSLQDHSYSHSNSKLNNKQTIAIETQPQSKLTLSQADAIIDQAVDLIGSQDFRPYFFKTLYMIGPTAFYEAMDWARKTDAKCKSCMFAKRLKELRRPHEEQIKSQSAGGAPQTGPTNILTEKGLAT